MYSGPCLIHPGFAHAATTTIQDLYFTKSEKIFYAGIPYGDFGGLFSHIKYTENFEFNYEELHNWVDMLITQRRGDRTVVISDETIINMFAGYFQPVYVPRDLIANRLKRYFPEAKILFTIREQRSHITSMYLNLYRSHLINDGIIPPDFDRWFAGNLSQTRTAYFQSINYCKVINLYETQFGKENILVLPMEHLKSEGVVQYCKRIADFAGIPFEESDIQNSESVRNPRMTTREWELYPILLHGPARKSGLSLVETHEFRSFARAAPPAEITFSERQINQIRSIVAAGNRQLAASYNLPLDEFGYLME